MKISSIAYWNNEFVIQIKRFKLTALREDLCYVVTHIVIGTFLSAYYYNFVSNKSPDISINLLVNELPVLFCVILLLLIFKIVQKYIFFDIQFNILKICKILYSRFIEATLYIVGLNFYYFITNTNDYASLLACIITSYFFSLFSRKHQG